MAEKKIVIAEIDINYDDALKDTAKLADEIVELKKQQKELKAENKEGTEEYVRLTSQLKATQQQYRANERQLVNIQKAQTDGIGTLQKLKIENSKYRAELDTLDLTQAEGIARQQELNDAINANTEFIKENSDTQAQGWQSVGQYTKGIIEAVSALEKDAIAKKNNIKLLNEIIESESSSNKIKKESALLLEQEKYELAKINDELKDFGKSNDIDGYSESIAQANEVTSLFSGSVSNVASNLVMMSQQEGGVKKTLGALTSGIWAAVKAGLVFLATPIGLAIAGLAVAVGTFSAAISSNQSMADSWGQKWAGVIGVASKLWADYISVTTGATQSQEQLNYTMEQAYEDGKKLEKMQQDLSKSTIQYTVSAAKLSKTLEEQAQIAGDSTLSFQEQEDAQLKVIKTSNDLAKANQKLAKQELEEAIERTRQEKLRVGAAGVSVDTLDSLAQSTANLINANKELNVSTAENATILRQIAQDKAEKDLDILIDGFDNQKMINERRIADDRLSLAERGAILNETAALSNKSFLKQVDALQAFTSESINANDLLNTSDAVRLKEKIRTLGLSEIMEGRLLEVIRDRRTAVLDLSEAEQELNKQALELRKEQVAESIRILGVELDTWKINNRKKLEDDLGYLEVARDRETAYLEEKQLKYEDYKLALAEIDARYDDQAEALRIEQQAKEDEIKATEVQNALDAQQINLDNEFALAEGQVFRLIDLERQRLAIQEKQEIAAAEKVGADTNLIKEKYRKADLALDAAVVDAKLSMTAGAAANIATILGEQTKAGKAAAVVATTIETYRGAQAAFAQTPGGIVIKSLAAGNAVATGIANVNKIISTPETSTSTPSAPSGVSIGGFSGGDSSQGALSNLQDIQSSIGNGILSRDNSDSLGANKSETVLVYQDVKAAQTEDLNRVKNGNL